MKEIEWKTSESRLKPLALDTTISQEYVYLRKDINAVEAEDSQGDYTKYVYQEAIIGREDFKALGNNGAKVLYELALSTPVEYPANNHIYKPAYIDDYFKEMQRVKIALELIKLAGGDITPILAKTINIYDATNLKENRVSMTVLELSNLYLFLYLKKEELYNEYREALDAFLES